MSSVASVSSDYPLYLSDSPIRFEPLGVATTVAIFFDDANHQVFTVRSNGAAGVVVKGPDNKVNITFRLEDRGEITSLSFSSDLRVLAIQRSPRSVDFINLFVGGDVNEYSQTCKGKGTKIIGFCWTALYEIVYITDHGIEQYQVLWEKKMLKLLKTFSLSVNWFLWSRESGVLLLSSGTLGTTIHPFTFKGMCTRMSKFEMEPHVSSPAGQRSVDQRDVVMAVIYDELYVIQLPPQPRNTCSDVFLYKIKDIATYKTDVLRVSQTGRLTVNVIDNIVVIHHQPSKTSLLYDIHLPCETVNGINFHQPFSAPFPVSPYKLVLPAVPTPGGVEMEHLTCDLYAQTCVMFQPDVVLDAKLGCFWYLRLKLEPLLSVVGDKCKLIDFLLMRRDSKPAILTLCGDVLTVQHQSSLVIASSIFNKLNRIYRCHMETNTVLGFDGGGKLDVVSPSVKYSPVIDQSDIYTHLFSKFDQSKSLSYKFIIGVLVEYIRSLSFYQIPVQHYLYELIITTLVQHSCFYQLHQFLQYHVLTDSKHLACSLLSLEGAYPPAYQLALDMMKRLQTADESIVEVLLSKKRVLTALRFVRSVGLSDQVTAWKFLEAARSSDCSMTYYTVFRFFEQRNLRLHGSAKFLPGDRCEPYVKHFQDLFPDTCDSQSG